MFRSSNPVLTRQESFASPQPTYYGSQQDPYGSPSAPPQARAVMTMEDVIAKTAICLGLVAAIAALAWFLVPMSLVTPVLVGAGLLSIVAVVVVAIKKTVNPVMVLGYAVIEGVFVGMLSKLFEMYYPGIVMNAVVATFVVAGVVLVAYRFFGLGKIANRIRKVVVIATAGLALALVANFMLNLFGVFDLGLRAGVTGPVGLLPILVSAVAVVLAALNLILDFEFVEQGIRNRIPASQSWVAAFGLTVTMVWLYTELLRILSYFRR